MRSIKDTLDESTLTLLQLSTIFFLVLLSPVLILVWLLGYIRIRWFKQ